MQRVDHLPQLTFNVRIVHRTIQWNAQYCVLFHRCSKCGTGTGCTQNRFHKSIDQSLQIRETLVRGFVTGERLGAPVVDLEFYQ